MGFAAPEVFAGKVGPPMDVYSLGSTMFYLLTGSDPRENPLLVFDFSRNPRPRQINPAITPEMDELLVRMVTYKPEGRPTSTEVERALQEHERRLARGV